MKTDCLSGAGFVNETSFQMIFFLMTKLFILCLSSTCGDLPVTVHECASG